MEKLYVRFTDDAECAGERAVDPDKRLRKILKKAKRRQEEARHLARDDCLLVGQAEVAHENIRRDREKRKIGDRGCELEQDNDVAPVGKKARPGSKDQGIGTSHAVPEASSDTAMVEAPKGKKKTRRKRSQQIRVRRDRRKNLTVGLQVDGDLSPKAERAEDSEEVRKNLTPELQVDGDLQPRTERSEDRQHKPTASDDDVGAMEFADTENGAPDDLREPAEVISREYYPVLGDVQVKKIEAVHRVLPEWLSNPEVVQSIVKKGKKPGSAKVENFTSSLSAEMLSVLATNNIRKLFPVQEKVVPWLLSPEQRRSHLPPRDICVSAPTGSGKTLAYVIPIVEALKGRVVRAVRAVVVLPVKELAVQVHAVFLQYVRATSLNVQLVTGTRTFAEEQALLVRKTARGLVSLADIVVATPGRLLDHVRKTPGFNLHLLKFFVLDEADRVIEDVQTTLIPEVEQAVFGADKLNCCCKEPVHGRLHTHPLTICCLQNCREPVQKLLYSATLTQDPDKLQSLMLFQPKLFTATAALSVEGVTQRQKTFVGKYTTPQGLSEYYYVTLDNTKPLAVWDLVANHGFRDTLCFTASKEDAHRLSLVLKEMGGVRAEEFSAKLSSAERARVLRKFASGKLDILVCSNVLARGLDVPNVRHVICYDPPRFIKTYVHRVGRTARAGVPGTAVTFMRQGQLQAFKAMLESAGKQDIQPLDTSESDGLEEFQSKYRDALKAVEVIVKSEQNGPERGKKYSFAQKSWAAKEAPDVQH
ncbi:putative ATP-dependent RNA helicase Dbp73D [Amblyomma americanum]